MVPTADAPAATLVARFRRQRPLRAGSLIVTIFGDAIAPRGGRVLLGSLIRLAAPFGIGERLVRTSVARLAQDGWLESRRDGRLSEYRLSRQGRRRFADATRRIYSPNPASWDRRWTLVLLPPGDAAQRGALRQQLRWLGYGQLEPGVLVHPALTPAATLRQLQGQPGAGRLLFLRSAGDEDRDADLVAAGWDLDALAGGYREFTRRFGPVADAVGDARALPARDAFIVRTLLVHEFRRLHLRDPLLPAPLLPEGWPGERAYELCRGLYARVFDAAEDWLSAEGRRQRGALPAPEAATWRRFGGLGRR